MIVLELYLKKIKIHQKSIKIINHIHHNHHDKAFKINKNMYTIK